MWLQIPWDGMKGKGLLLLLLLAILKLRLSIWGWLKEFVTCPFHLADRDSWLGIYVESSCLPLLDSKNIDNYYIRYLLCILALWSSYLRDQYAFHYWVSSDEFRHALLLKVEGSGAKIGLWHEVDAVLVAVFLNQPLHLNRLLLPRLFLRLQRVIVAVFEGSVVVPKNPLDIVIAYHAR